ncbi:MAG: DUF1294 domain-containing protein [Clostridiales bacterium]|nr:DUF1294 domain-containing protein [Clostridiales bacterium]
MENLLWYYLIAVNLGAFCVAAYDKLCALRQKWRVPEKTLFFFALALGGMGLYLSFLLFRHKIRKPKFMLGVPVIMAVQVLLYLVFK